MKANTRISYGRSRLVFAAGLLLAVAMGVVFLMFSEITVTQQNVEKTLENDKFIQ